MNRSLSTACPRATAAGPRAVALLEVVFALALFTAAASTILSGVIACIRSAERMQAEATAADLIVTLLSEIQMDLVEPEDDGPNEYDPPYEGWTWEIVTLDFDEVIEGPEMKSVEIVIANESLQYVSRLRWLISNEETGDSGEDESSDPAESSGGGEAEGRL